MAFIYLFLRGRRWATAWGQHTLDSSQEPCAWHTLNSQEAHTQHTLDSSQEHSAQYTLTSLQEIVPTTPSVLFRNPMCSTPSVLLRRSFPAYLLFSSGAQHTLTFPQEIVSSTPSILLQSPVPGTLILLKSPMPGTLSILFRSAVPQPHAQEILRCGWRGPDRLPALDFEDAKKRPTAVSSPSEGTSFLSDTCRVKPSAPGEGIWGQPWQWASQMDRMGPRSSGQLQGFKQRWHLSGYTARVSLTSILSSAHAFEDIRVLYS